MKIFLSKWLLLLACICTLFACGQQKKSSDKLALAHYAPDDAIVTELPMALREISGMTFISGDDQTLYVEQDEDGKVYSIQLSDMQTKLFSTIHQKGDFEDLTYWNNLFYLLRSDGVIFSFPSKSNFTKKEIISYKNILPEAEYEGLFATSDGSLYALTKHIPAENSLTYVYRLKPNANGFTADRETIDISKIEKSIQQNLTPFRPSAIAFNIIDQQWYVLSSVNRILLVLNNKWELQDYCMLDRKKYPQPEGMTFDSKGNLWLSSEAGNQKTGKIYKIERH